jgi:hypothetical protein
LNLIDCLDLKESIQEEDPGIALFISSVYYKNYFNILK